LQLEVVRGNNLPWPFSPKHGPHWLAGALLESIDATVDASAEQEWNKEIARRIEGLDSGKVKPIPWEQARRQISAILHGR